MNGLKAVAAFMMSAVYAFPLLSQIPEPLWVRNFGGTGDDAARDIAPVHDGGWIVTGFTTSYGNGGQDLYLIRLDADGDTLWTCAAGGSEDDVGRAVIETSDHGFIAVGYTYSFGAGNDDVYIVKVDSVGNILWSKTYGGYSADEAYDITAYGDSAFLIAGRTYSFGAGNFDVYLLAIDLNGDTFWTRTYGGDITDGAWRVVPLNGEKFVLVGYTFSYGAGNYDAFLIEIDSTGEPLWQATYGGYDDDVATDAVETPDSGLLIIGYTYTYANGPEDVFVVKARLDGAQQWSSHFGGGSQDEGWGISRLTDGNYMVAGVTHSYGSGGADAYLVELNPQGTVTGYRTFGSAGTDGLGSIHCSQATGRCAVAGYTEVQGLEAQAMVACFQFTPHVDEDGIAPLPKTLSWLDGKVRLMLPVDERVELDVYDSGGRQISRLFDGRLAAGNHEFSWYPSHSGVFFLRLRAGSSVRVVRIVHFR